MSPREARPPSTASSTRGNTGMGSVRKNGTIQILQIDVTLDVGNKFVRRKEKNRLTNKGR
jgi:hypothetical protein